MGKNIAILGATGVVGRQMLKCLEERDFDVDNLRLLASARSAGKTIQFKSQNLKIEDAQNATFENVDIVLGAAENDIAKQLAPSIVESGAVFVDNSSAFRMYDDVPLVVPEINAQDVQNHKGIISNPNCSTIIALVAISGIARLTKINSIVASTYQAASGAGKSGLEELKEQMFAYSSGKNLENSAFAHQLALNLIPAIGSDTGNGYTSEEMKMQNEGRKILHLPNLNVTCTCVRVPVMRSHSISLSLFLEDVISPQEVRRAISCSYGCKLIDELGSNRYPMPLFASDQDKVFVGRIRQGLTAPNEISLWCSGDQIRKGAATNAVQIAELVTKM